ncbi:hypothetical protein M527_06480 [Sphingobium indicum IP26]|uniref:Uncharacterized protein n=1 Tax=Sphingobium indicum F2 TaxID=1450518 RepID=A0A8E0WU45_9SPHN|nr:hypothetical protein [Sphingobium indicum]EPR09770.1 hypothetical protein M527_06480 [Sphingobium indicum IP26]KER37279.1 hypothetical protein AL00_06310 [Sphingobium indicum F2]
MEDMKVGETFSVAVPIYRKWWQIWKPRIATVETRMFRVKAITRVTDGDISWPRVEVEKD